MTHLVIGKGEIGKAIASIFNCEAINKNDITKEMHYDILHICIPYSEEFYFIVLDYQKQFSAKYTVIHSTVLPGTSRMLNAINSPCLGIHPFLEPGIRTFTKFLSGPQASEIADEFRRVGLKVYLFDDQETSEFMKILDTTFYGICIEYTKDVKKICKENRIPFEAWKLWTDNYNEGYKKLGCAEYIRPNLVPIMKPIGGHCVMPNIELIDTKFTRLLKEINE